MGVKDGLYKEPYCQLSGYLDVKHPSGNRGKVLIKVWKRRYVVLNSMTNNTTGDTEAKFEVYMSKEDWIQGKSRVPLLPERPSSIRRCYSRTRAYAFKILSESGMVLLYLAGSDETDSQNWMRELRQIYWPWDTLKAPENSTEIAIIDNSSSEELKLVGSYHARVSSEGLCLLAPTDGSLVRKWALRDLRRFFVAKTQHDADKNKVFSIITKSECGDEENFVFFVPDAQNLLQRICQNISAMNEQTLPKTPTEEADDDVERRSRSNTDSTTVSDKSDHSYSSCKNWNNPNARNTVCTTRSAPRPKDSYDYLFRTFGHKHKHSLRLSEHSHISEDDSEFYSRLQTRLGERYASEWDLSNAMFGQLIDSDSLPNLDFECLSDSATFPRRGKSVGHESTLGPGSHPSDRTSGYSNVDPSLDTGDEYMDMSNIQKLVVSDPDITASSDIAAARLQTTESNKNPEENYMDMSSMSSSSNYLPMGAEAASIHKAFMNVIGGETEGEYLSMSPQNTNDGGAIHKDPAYLEEERRASESSISVYSTDSVDLANSEELLMRTGLLKEIEKRMTSRTAVIDEIYPSLNDVIGSVLGNIDNLLESRTSKDSSREDVNEDAHGDDEDDVYDAIFPIERSGSSPVQLRRSPEGEPKASLDSGIVVSASSSTSTSTQSSRSNSSYADEKHPKIWILDENDYKTIANEENFYELEEGLDTVADELRSRAESVDSEIYQSITPRASRGNTLTEADDLYVCPNDPQDPEDIYEIFEGPPSSRTSLLDPFGLQSTNQPPVRQSMGMTELEKLQAYQKEMSLVSKSLQRSESTRSGFSVSSVVTEICSEETPKRVSVRARRSGAIIGPPEGILNATTASRPTKLEIPGNQSIELDRSSDSPSSSEALDGKAKRPKDGSVKRKKRRRHIVQAVARLWAAKKEIKSPDSKVRSTSNVEQPNEEGRSAMERLRKRSKSEETPPSVRRDMRIVTEKIALLATPSSPISPGSQYSADHSSLGSSPPNLADFDESCPPALPPRSFEPGSKEIQRSKSVPEQPSFPSLPSRTTYPPPPVPPRPPTLAPNLSVQQTIVRRQSLQKVSAKVSDRILPAIPSEGVVMEVSKDGRELEDAMSETRERVDSDASYASIETLKNGQN